MTLSRIEEAKKKVDSRRSALAFAERDLQKTVSAFLMNRPEGVRQIARKMDFTPAYVSDLIHGRRGPSGAVLEKLKCLI